MKCTVFALLFLISLNAKAYLQIHWSANYSSDNNDWTDEKSEYGRLSNLFYLAASYARNDRALIGQSIMSWNKTMVKGNSDTATTISLLELGPRLDYYLNQDKNWFIGVAWHPYAKGTRTIADGTSEEISGSSYYGIFGYQLKLSRTFFLGASIIYHTLSLESSVVSNEEETLSDTITTVMPFFEISLRFK